MRKSMITIAIFATVSGFAQDKPKCSATTKAGISCKLVVWNKSNLCWRHNPNYVKTVELPSVVCSATTSVGLPCKTKTKHSSGVCHHHRPKTN
jgi:hypothetical protein